MVLQKPLITPALFSHRPPTNREKRENNKIPDLKGSGGGRLEAELLPDSRSSYPVKPPSSPGRRGGGWEKRAGVMRALRHTMGPP